MRGDLDTFNREPIEKYITPRDHAYYNTIADASGVEGPTSPSAVKGQNSLGHQMMVVVYTTEVKKPPKSPMERTKGLGEKAESGPRNCDLPLKHLRRKSKRRGARCHSVRKLRGGGRKKESGASNLFFPPLPDTFPGTRKAG